MWSEHIQSASAFAMNFYSYYLYMSPTNPTMNERRKMSQFVQPKLCMNNFVVWECRSKTKANSYCLLWFIIIYAERVFVVRVICRISRVHATSSFCASCVSCVRFRPEIFDSVMEWNCLYIGDVCVCLWFISALLQIERECETEKCRATHINSILRLCWTKEFFWIDRQRAACVSVCVWTSVSLSRSSIIQ